jgi:response regulator RpfG family c-di-GMP phosphodiesterase
LAVNAAGPSLLSLKKGADALLGAGALTAEQHASVLKYIQRTQMRSEDAVLTLGLMTESALLKALSNLYKTRFISTEKLSKAEIARSLLDMVPHRVAERYAVFPVIFDADANALTVVTADPDDLEALKEIALVAGVRETRPILARPASVKAAIARSYAGEMHAFARLDGALDFHVSPSDEPGIIVRNSPAARPMGHLRERLMSERELKAVPQPPPPPVPASKKTLPASTAVPAVSAAPASALPAPSAASPPPLPRTYAGDTVLELLNVLVSLIENSRQELRGHSAQVARLVRRLGERMNLSKEQLVACGAAAFVHDLGKMGQYHLTALNCAEYEGHKLAAQKSHDTPGRLLEAVKLAPETLDGVAHIYERYDGKGFPGGLAGKDIPLIARILAVADTYADLTQNTRNPYRKQLPPAEAFAVLDKFKEQIFDPHLVDLFRAMLTGEDVRAKLLADRLVALIVDADPEETTVLELRMIEQGFEVKIARSVADATKALENGEIDLVVSEVDLPGGDGLALLAAARKQPWGKDVPWVIHTRKQGRTEAQRAFELGVLDYASKLSPADVLVAKLKAMLDQRVAGRGASGVSGSLNEMGLPDMVQVLWHARKTGNLNVRSGGEPGEIHFQEGNVVDAAWGKARGADAFYALLRLKDGDFAFDPTFRPKTRAIRESSETLLLEGMRRLDEGIA